MKVTPVQGLRAPGRRHERREPAMRRLLCTLVVALPLLALSVEQSGAHRSFSAVYDEKQVITVEGVVTEFRFVNAHAMMSPDVKDKSGKAPPRPVESAARPHVMEGRWT